MRLLIISQHFWPEEFRINDLAVELNRRGVEVTVLTGIPNYPHGVVNPDYRADPARFDELDSVPILRVPLVPRGRAGALRLALNYLSFAASSSTLGLLRLRTRRFDASLVFLSSPATQALPAVLLRSLRGVPSLIWVQDLWPESLSALGAVRSRSILGIVGAAVGALYRASAVILIQSEAFRADVEKRAGRPVDVRYFPNWSEPNLAEGLDGVAVATELLPFKGAFNIMFAGNMGEAQGLSEVVEAAHLCRDLADVRWILVGDGRARADVEARVRVLGLEDRVFFMGRYASHRMPEFLAGADATLVSLRSDPIFAMTIPSKVQSYLAAGRPVLGMLDGEGARVIEDSGGGLCVPAGDAGGLASLVRRLRAMSAEERKAMGGRARAYALENFDFGTLVDRLLEWMQASIKSSGCRS